MNTNVLDHNKFREFLFSHPEPPASNSLMIDIDLSEDHTATVYDFLYELFVYGIDQKKDIYFQNYPNNSNQEFLEWFNGYFHAIGFNVKILSYSKNDNTVSGNVTFENWTN